jgi:hypothetical protein
MSSNISNSGNKNRPVLDHVHPLVYAAVIGLAFWFVVSAVVGFGSDGYADFLLVVVGTFIVIAVAIPCLLWLTWSRHQEPATPAHDHGDGESFRDWASGELDTWQDRLAGRNAAVEILLPIAAVAFGMTAFGIVLHFAAHAAA